MTRMRITALLFQLQALVGIPWGHVRKDHLITHSQSIQNFNDTDRTPPKFNLRSAHGFSTVKHLEETDRALTVALYGTAHEEHRVQPFEFDNPFHIQVRTSAARQRSFQGHVHSYRSVLGCRINPTNTASDNPVARINLCL